MPGDVQPADLAVLFSAPRLAQGAASSALAPAGGAATAEPEGGMSEPSPVRRVSLMGWRVAAAAPATRERFAAAVCANAAALIDRSELAPRRFIPEEIAGLLEAAWEEANE